MPPRESPRSGRRGVIVALGALAGVLALLVTAACSGSSAAERPPAPGAPPAAHRCYTWAGALTDLRGEPPAWRANTSGRTWTTAGGCMVRVDVIADYDGPEHCDFQSARHVVVGRPVGSRFTENAHVYVRDPENVYRDAETSRKLDLDAALPPSAGDTGLRLGATELWAVPGEPRWIYLRKGEAVERWPLDREPTWCA
jgi:hypothetical protein